jgi:hypothetical protein
MSSSRGLRHPHRLIEPWAFRQRRARRPS